MLITNTSKSIRGFHDKHGKPVMLQPGEERNVDIDAGTQALLKRMGDDYRLGGGGVPVQEQKPEHIPYVREEEPAQAGVAEGYVGGSRNQPRRGRPRK